MLRFSNTTENRKELVDENEKCLGMAPDNKLILTKCGALGTKWVVTSDGKWANEACS
jgi:hypothetical protein